MTSPSLAGYQDKSSCEVGADQGRDSVREDVARGVFASGGWENEAVVSTAAMRQARQDQTTYLMYTSCIKQMPRISMHMFTITSICSFFLIPLAVTQFGPLFSCLFWDNDGDHHLALGTVCADYSEQTRGQLSRTQGPLKTHACLSLLRFLSPRHHSALTESVLSFTRC
jgi:hypothetical protein